MQFTGQGVLPLARVEGRGAPRSRVLTVLRDKRVAFDELDVGNVAWREFEVVERVTEYPGDRGEVGSDWACVV